MVLIESIAACFTFMHNYLNAIIPFSVGFEMHLCVSCTVSQTLILISEIYLSSHRKDILPILFFTVFGLSCEFSFLWKTNDTRIFPFCFSKPLIHWYNVMTYTALRTMTRLFIIHDCEIKLLK